MMARLIIAKALEDRQALFEEILKNKSLKIYHPDVLYIKDEEKLGIQQAKKIIEHLSFKPLKAEGKAVVVESAQNLTVEAQNALLKTLEEPPEQALIILAAEDENNLLPTILSRCQLININQARGTDNLSEDEDQVEQFIKMDVTGRFDFIEKLEDKEAFLQALTVYFRQQALDFNQSALESSKLLLEAHEWAQASINLRAILEYLALKLKVV